MPSKHRKQKSRTAASFQARSLDHTNTLTTSAPDSLLGPSPTYSNAVRNVDRQQSPAHEPRSNAPAYNNNKRRQATQWTVFNNWRRGPSEADAQTNWRRRDSEVEVKAGIPMRLDSSSGPYTSLTSETTNHPVAYKLSECSSCHQRFPGNDSAKHTHRCDSRPKDSVGMKHAATYRGQSSRPRYYVVKASRSPSKSHLVNREVASHSGQACGGTSPSGLFIKGSTALEDNHTLRSPASPE